MRKVFLLAIMIAITLLPGKASAKYYSALYGTYMDYSSGNKTSGLSSSFYISSGNIYQTTSLGISVTRAKERNLVTSAGNGKQSSFLDTNYIDQLDFTVLYSNTGEILEKHTFSFGFHYIKTDDILTDEGKIVYFDGTYFVPYRWNVGVETVYSFYPSTDVIQVAPHMGKYFYKDENRFYTWVKSYCIFLENSEDLSVSDSFYFSAEAGLSLYRENYDLGLTVWVGRQILTVKNSGFTVYNLSDVYKGGITAEGGYSLNKNYRIGATISVNRFEYPDTGENAFQTTFTTYLGYSW